MMHLLEQRVPLTLLLDLLDDDRRGDRISTDPVVGLGHVHGVQVGIDQRLEYVVRELARLVDLGSARRDLVVRHLTNGLAEQLVLLGEHEGVERWIHNGILRAIMISGLCRLEPANRVEVPIGVPRILRLAHQRGSTGLRRSKA